MKKLSGVLALAATAAIWSLAGNAVANWGNDPGGCGPGMGRERMEQMHERRKTELHDRLKLNADQEKAWKTFVAKEDELRLKDRPDPKELAGLHAPQRMEKMLDHMRDREKHLSGMLAALNDFYSVLTPQQQQTFDESLPGPVAHGMRGGHGGSSGESTPDKPLS
jgi:periplasmic protein CpxP/Spy